jgi:cyclohexanone monooxygenase
VQQHDAVVVGAGFAGLYALHRLRQLGLSVRAFEAGGGVGGTWYWNRYPGARCDVESLDYSYSFSHELQQEWAWSERYASQPEILRYLEHVADRFDLRRDVQLRTRVTSAAFDEQAGRWEIVTDRGAASARFCVLATGCLSVPQAPDLPGLADFQGRQFHTARWPHEGVDFTARRVGVVGTGSSGVQSIPLIARQAAHLFVFQRTPSFCVPAWNAPLDPERERQVKDAYAEYRRQARESRVGFVVPTNAAPALQVDAEARRQAYESSWARGGLGFAATFPDLLLNRDANDTAAEFVRARIRDVVRDPAVADALTPRAYPVGAKRLCVDTDYYATFNRDNVTLVDLRQSPLEGVTAQGIRTRDREYALDDLVLATGFDAMTGAVLKIDLRGRGGLELRRKWANGPRAYLGLAVAGFPNLFLITGPGSPSVISNMIVSIEQHVDWIADCIAHLRSRGLGRIEAVAEAEDAWAAHVNEIGNLTLYPLADSWYVGANVPGKPRALMPYLGGVGLYRQTCAAVAAKGYEGFILSA